MTARRILVALAGCWLLGCGASAGGDGGNAGNGGSTGGSGGTSRGGNAGTGTGSGGTANAGGTATGGGTSSAAGSTSGGASGNGGATASGDASVTPIDGGGGVGDGDAGISVDGGGGNGGEGGDDGGVGGATACTWSPSGNPCGEGFYCNAPGCGSGSCEPVVPSSDAARSPVCGCDGADYWNADIAVAFGMAVSASGRCATPKFCGGIAALRCPDEGHSCSMAFSDVGGCNISDAGGECWGLPPACASTDDKGWRPYSSASASCTSEGDARTAGLGAYPDATCPR